MEDFVFDGYFVGVSVEFLIGGRVIHYRGLAADLEGGLYEVFSNEKARRLVDAIYKRLQPCLPERISFLEDAITCLRRAEKEGLTDLSLLACFVSREKYRLGEKDPLFHLIEGTKPQADWRLLGFDVLTPLTDSIIFDSLMAIAGYEVMRGDKTTPTPVRILGRYKPRHSFPLWDAPSRLEELIWIFEHLNANGLFPDVKNAEECFRNWWNYWGRHEHHDVPEEERARHLVAAIYEVQE